MSWEYLKISDFAEVITGGTPSTTKKEYWEGGTIPWLNSGELNQEIVVKCDNLITELGIANSAAKLMPQDTVLIALTGATTGVVGYLTFEACANQSVTGILPSKRHHPKFLYYYLKSIREKVLSESYGGAQKHISQGYVKDLEIPLPPLATQKRIAEILDAADALRRKDQELLKKYDELAQTIFIDMFGDPVKNEKGWDVKSLDYFGYWKSGGTPSRTKKSFFEGEISWISSGELNDVFISNSIEHINEEAITNSSTSIIEEGSLLLGMYDTAALKSSINKIKLCCNQAIAFSKLNEKNCNTLFIYYFIQVNKDELKKGQRGVRQKNLNLTMIKELKILNPPKEMQDTFAKRYKKVLELKDKINNQKVSNSLFNSLIQKAFNGELVS